MSNRNVIFIITFFILGLFLEACSSPNPQPAGLTPIPTLAPGATVTLVPAIQASSATNIPATTGVSDPALGAPIYLKNCSPCHGNQGQGVDAPTLRNNKFIQTGNNTDVFQTIANGRPGTEMPAWLQTNGGPLTNAEISNVIAYLHTLQNVSPLPTSTPMPPEPTATPLPANAPTPEPARPSNPGNPGMAVTLTGDATRGKSLFGTYCAVCHGPEGVQGVSNPGSDDGSVPTLKPIDSTIANADKKIFATNIDLFVEHGSIPSGDKPMIVMPSFGDSKMLTNQQIADLIAYVMSLNSAK